MSIAAPPAAAAAAAQRRACWHRPRARPPAGAALLVAMVLLTLVATLAAGMVWQQWRAVEVEVAERGRVQMAWMMNGAIDWARLILREDFNASNRSAGRKPTSDQGVWAQDLKESRLSTFLAADANNSADADVPEVFLSGSISDGHARYNLGNLQQLADGKVPAAKREQLVRLCRYAGIGEDNAARIADGYAAAVNTGDSNAPLLPRRLEDLAWFGLDSATIERLRPLAIVLPAVAGKVNPNTASREVLAIAIDGLDLASAEKLVQARKNKPFATPQEVQDVLGATPVVTAEQLSFVSEFFEVNGRMRYEDNVLEEQSLIQRREQNVFAVQRQRVVRMLPR